MTTPAQTENNDAKLDLQVNNSPLQHYTPTVTGEFINFDNERYYRIAHSDQMPPFFMSLVSGNDHWLFISSNGGLTAGRIDANSALFPYDTEDKITNHHESTGAVVIVRVKRDDKTYLWRPFSDQYADLYHTERHLYKNAYGNKLVFEEINHDLGLSQRIIWRTSDKFGFVKTGWLHNQGDACHIELLTGLQNILPYGATKALQTSMSSLLHAYKRNELDPDTGLGLFTLSATLTDMAEPSESLMATVAWQLGLHNPTHLLTTNQLDQFCAGYPVTPEHDICGQAGSYLVQSNFDLPADGHQQWHIIADVNQTRSAVTALLHLLQNPHSLESQIETDINAGTNTLVKYVAMADGLQLSDQENTTVHHFANVMFNIMRGGIFNQGYTVTRADLHDFVQVRNHAIFNQHQQWFNDLPTQIDIRDLYDRAQQTNEADIIRLCYEYLPLTFSRRHGDPSRPWNWFSINLKNEDGSPQLNYQGNWRDIFQNWEPLAFSFPQYSPGLIAKFLNATTADGYNPYRVTRDGIEWEVPEPENPWANIGYWSDHQIIYLQKLLETAEQLQPNSLKHLFNQPIFAYANVPYRLHTYNEMLADWSDTITFDWDAEKATEALVAKIGTDGRLLHDKDGNVIHVNMIEKLLTLLLAKLANFVPDGGIWMNTQRPEWNDANNALVGKGLSVVTTAYLYRFINFLHEQLAHVDTEQYAINHSLADLLTSMHQTFSQFQDQLGSGFDLASRRAMLDGLGQAITAYRATIYDQGVPAQQREIAVSTLRSFLALVQTYIEQTLRANKREDGLYHTYNILRIEENGLDVDYLYLMLEGQVAILSAGLLAPAETVSLLKSLRQSPLYRQDQHTYMLYPHRQLPGFLHKNNVSADDVASSALVKRLQENNDVRLLTVDTANVYHFNGRFRNAKDVKKTLATLAQDPAYTDLVTQETQFILDLFEKTFDHKAFTGRSGTFFAYEGLGSIYWHMVSKLLLAVQECYFQAVATNADQELIDALEFAYYDVRAGIGFNKTPTVYGAFPTDPYSHTPWGHGARQPGMTGQVKEEVLTRWGELGALIHDGQLYLAPTMLKADELLPQPQTFTYIGLNGEEQQVELPANSLAFTVCQLPIIYEKGANASITVYFADGRQELIEDNHLSPELTQQIFARNGQISLIRATVTI
ncbi:MAG TPA: hypothetical protein VLL52_22765 [Anaerolineae bacterium]|nr:hypothetical protein [Anaerolineae bacterium]